LAQALKAGNVCSECKELPPMQKGRRKFTRCVDCRAEATRLAWHRRKNLRELRNMVGGLVEYNDGGWRAGYLAEIYNKSTVWVQPIGTMLQVPQKVCLGVEEVKPALVGSKKWPRMEDYVKAVLIMRPSKVQPKPAPVAVDIETLPGPAIVIGTPGEAPVRIGLDLAEKVDIALPHVGDSGRSEIAMDMPKAVAMYKAGQTWTEIAVAMGYPRGKGQNRCKRAVEKAGAL
jgi:hypothetical protein